MNCKINLAGGSDKKLVLNESEEMETETRRQRRKHGNRKDRCNPKLQDPR